MTELTIAEEEEEEEDVEASMRPETESMHDLFTESMHGLFPADIAATGGGGGGSSAGGEEDDKEDEETAGWGQHPVRSGATYTI